MNLALNDRPLLQAALAENTGLKNLIVQLQGLEPGCGEGAVCIKTCTILMGMHNSPVVWIDIKRVCRARATCLGAAGALEAVLSLLAMKHQVALPTLHLQHSDPECDLDYVPNTARTGVAARVMLSNSFAFGGTNAVLVLGAGRN